MIIHNIAFKLATDDAALRAEQASEFKTRIESLGGRIPGLKSISVGVDVGRIDGHFDLVLISTHDTYEDLVSYQAHPLHQEVIEFGKAIVSDRACVDYET